MTEILARLSQVLEERKSADPDSSYVAKLYAKGLDAILKKIGEEATETVMAAKDGVPERIVCEVADLWFHSLVLLAHQGLGPEQVLAELDRRFGLSGLAEKAARGPEPGTDRPCADWGMIAHLRRDRQRPGSSAFKPFARTARGRRRRPWASADFISGTC